MLHSSRLAYTCDAFCYPLHSANSMVYQAYIHCTTCTCSHVQSLVHIVSQHIVVGQSVESRFPVDHAIAWSSFRLAQVTPVIGNCIISWCIFNERKTDNQYRLIQVLDDQLIISNYVYSCCKCFEVYLYCFMALLHKEIRHYVATIEKSEKPAVTGN